MKRLSFVVPCYNVERYVGHCLDGILSCGLSSNEYEVICVNDCSSDSTLAVLRRYAMHNAQIRVLNLEQNIGFGAVRNIAVENARGRYIWFVDSDDAIISNVVVELLERAENNQLDVLAFNFDALNEEQQLMPTNHTFPNAVAQDGVSFVKNVMGEMFYANIGYVWRFLYRKDYLLEQKISYPEGMCWEDTVYVPMAMIKADRIASSSLVGYHYFFHQSSVCRVMERKYPGNLIFDYVFRAGYGLMRYAETIDDQSLSDGLICFAKKKYLRDNFIVYLLRTTGKERRNFFRIVKKQSQLVNEVKPYISDLGRLALIPIVGAWLADIASWAYKFRRKK